MFVLLFSLYNEHVIIADFCGLIVRFGALRNENITQQKFPAIWYSAYNNSRTLVIQIPLISNYYNNKPDKQKVCMSRSQKNYLQMCLLIAMQ